MFGILLYYTVGLKLFIFNGCSAANTTINSHVSFFEYGIHIEGEEASLAEQGFIPYLTLHYTLNVTPTMPHLDQRFTYLRVEYVSPMSTVNINYNPDTFLLSFYIRFPFMDIPYGVVGYSLKRSRSRVWSSWRKSQGIQKMYLKGRKYLHYLDTARI